MARIVLNTFGSFGDLHPFLAVALGLKERGHQPVIATAELYRTKVQAEGIGFAPVRPDLGDKIDDREFVRKVWHPRTGPEFLFRHYIMPAVADSYRDLLPVCDGADLLLSHSATYAAPLVAEKLDLQWLSVALQPTVFLSKYDPPVLAPAPWVRYVTGISTGIAGLILSLGKRSTLSWSEPVRRLRKELGLKATKLNPIFEGQFSPFGTLAWFSRELAQEQPDWPENVTITGFPFYDKRGEGFSRWVADEPAEEREKLMRFLAAGSPPVLFTLGSSAVMEPGTFYKESFLAAQRLGVRALLLAGRMSRDEFPGPFPDSMMIGTYAPYSEVMPLCSAIVHQGGIGTTAQALRAGRPMIVVPWSHDQPDNAHRIERLGVGRTLPRGRYNASNAVRELHALLHNARYAEKAREIGERIQQENGVTAACDAIELLLRQGSMATPAGRI